MEQGNWWALVTEYLLTPEKDTVLVGDSREMKLLRYPNGEHYPDWSVSDKDADLLVPLLTPMAANSDVAKVYINGVDWTTSAPKDQSWGGVGYNPQTSQILYVAPSRKPKLNKALVTVGIKNPGSNATFLLSSEITILAESNLTINSHSFDNITVNGSMINGHLIATAAGFDSTGMSGKSQDRVQVKTEYPTPITLDKDITTKTRLFDRIIDPAKPDYVVATDILTKAELTVDQGVVVAFQRDKRLSIEKEGTIIAVGTTDQRIRFTGIEPLKSYWAGITMYSPSTANTLAFTDIEYGGSRVAFTGTKAGLALYGTTKTQVNLTDCRFITNDGYGLYVEDGAGLRTFARNRFEKQTEAPVLIDAYNATRLDAASAFTADNGRNVVEISSSSVTGTQEVNWPTFGDKTPYRLLGNLTVEADMTLQPGVTVEAARDGAISINKGGYLSAKGTATDKVTITGAARTAAYWKGIIVYSISNLNVFDQADISGGGSAVMVSGQRATVTVYGKGAKLTVKNSRVSNSGGYGILYTSDADLNADAGSANTLAGNAQDSLHKF